MECKKRFFVCKHCGNMVGMIFCSGVPIICCGEPMHELQANVEDASHEKHVPVIKVDGNHVTVHIGSAPHPMTEAHLIEWVYLETKKGGQRKVLKAGEAPVASFLLEDDEPVCAYIYCNLHGLWKADV